MRGELFSLDGLVTTNTCDHMLRLAGELGDKTTFPVHYFSMYHTLGRPFHGSVGLLAAPSFSMYSLMGWDSRRLKSMNFPQLSSSFV